MEPVRTCVGCRARAPRSSLLRIVARDGALVIDEKAVLPGRGAWVHDTDTCVTTALKRRAFGRALRASTPLDTAGLDARTTRESLQRNG
ncbi:YlxR family protein [Microbacterium sp. CnD16-F]|uniref:YlxR family protein n=1 Tax=Microbacterium gawkjiense TaxID=3067309 RepID=A0ABU3GD72_9MICO|nr:MULTISPECIES: YlxR family protein [unclassified Microbacterium]MCO7204457.1 YlxR family protein [Microbacterium sp. CnD16-F]MDT3317755.1 YlxR family protein [Microbacterium sp. KSW4-11]